MHMRVYNRYTCYVSLYATGNDIVIIGALICDETAIRREKMVKCIEPKEPWLDIDERIIQTLKRIVGPGNKSGGEERKYGGALTLGLTTV